MASGVAPALITAVATKAVVAICVVLVPEAAVGDVGVPVNVGEANGAFKLKSADKLTPRVAMST